MELLHPAIANRNCHDCLKHVYNEETGQRENNRAGEPLKRTKASPPPCQTTKGCPKGTPDAPRNLTENNARCVDHYHECRAVGVFPDDAVVRRNAAVILQAEELVSKKEQRDFNLILVQLVTSVSRFGLSK